MPETLQVTQKVLAHVALVDKFGNTITGVALDAPPVWVASNPLNLALAPAADGLSCEFTPTGTGAGTVETVTVSGAFKGVALAPAVLTVDLAAGNPSGFVVTFDAPVAQ